MAENPKDKTEKGVSKVIFNKGSHTINLYSYDSPPGLEEALGRIERLMQEIVKRLRATDKKTPSVSTEGFQRRLQ